jgi:carboxyl-terminal processing protease
LRKSNGKPLKGLVLDMRNNPGGVLEAAVAVADAFLDGGVIVSAKGRTPESKFEMDATPGDELERRADRGVGQRRLGLGR